MKQEERKIVLDLNRDISIQSTACSKNCRSIVFAMMAVTWGFLLNESVPIYKFVLSVELLIGIGYLGIETWRYFKTAKKARNLYKRAETKSDEQIDSEMTKVSDWAFSILHKQIWICVIMAVLLAVYVIVKYIIQKYEINRNRNEKMLVFSAAQGDETAHKMEEKHHGLFTYYLLKELQTTGGDVDMGTLTEYVTKQRKRQSVVINNKKQTPTVIPSQSLMNSWQTMKLK